ncbi:hypothetical protein [Maribacter sp. 2307ULW6-5]|uniref:hypothetical protein n=1 Tax=Maribacter sp. 2307ULW6-5 TaxID=3386275 RepID=UPI0039BD89C0
MEDMGKRKKINLNSLGILGVILLFFSTVSLRAQETPEQILQHFFELYKTSQEEAITYAYGTNPTLMEKEDSNYDEIIKTLDSLVPQLGKYHGSALIAETKLTTKIKHLSYLLKYEVMPIRLSLTLAKDDVKWKFFGITFDTNELVDEMIKAGLSLDNQITNAPKEVTSLVSDFFETYDRSTRQAVDFGMQGDVGGSLKDQENLNAAKTELEKFRQAVGEVQDYGILNYVEVANSYSYASYLVNFKEDMVRFSFLMYKPNKRWKIETFRFTGDILDQLQEATKIYRLKN